MLINDEKTSELSVLNRVLAVCEDGRSFYQHAAQEAESATLRQIFREQAQIRSEAIQQLSNEVHKRHGSPVHSGPLKGTLQQWYTDIRARLSHSQDHVFIQQLEETENQTLGELKRAVRSLHDPALARQLGSHLASIQLAHDRMKSIGEDLRARAH